MTPRRSIELTPEATQIVLSRLDEPEPTLPGDLRVLVRGDRETAALASALGQAVPLWIARMLVLSGVNTDHEIFAEPLRPGEFLQRAMPLMMTGLEQLSGEGAVKDREQAFTRKSVVRQVKEEHRELIAALRASRTVN